MKKQKFDCNECGARGTVTFADVCEETVSVLVCPACSAELESKDEENEELEFPTIDSDFD